MGWVAGLAGVAWIAVTAFREIGPMVQRGLEIRDVRVEGIHQVTKQEVIERLALKKGLALHQVSLSYLAERLRTHPWVKEATIERLPLHELRVSVIERKPAAIVRTGSEHVLVDDEGVALARLGLQDDQLLPLLTGVEAKPLLQGDQRVRRTIQSSVELARLMAHSVEGRVEIDLSNPANLVASAKGIRFQFGSEALVEQWNRFQMVKAVFKPGALEGRKREGGEVDLRYDNRVIVRERG
jgi:cell division protein FtsQ